MGEARDAGRNGVRKLGRDAWAALAAVLALVAAALGVSGWRASRRAKKEAKATQAAAKKIEDLGLKAVQREHLERLREAKRVHDEAIRKIDADLPGAVDDALDRARKRRDAGRG